MRNKIKYTGAKTDHQRRVYANIIELIASPENPTPLVRVNRLNPRPDFDIYLKLERYNAFGSVKDRIALAMLRGMNTGGKTIIEASSGNTGIALASLANALGVPVEIAVPEGIPAEKKLILKLLGARLWEADDDLCPRFPTEGARGLVDGLVKSPGTREKYLNLNQYENELNVAAHYLNTGPEIWQQTGGAITALFAGLGTCGTVTGTGRYLKEQNPRVKIIAIEPASPQHSLPGLKRITGLDESLVPKILDKSVIDEIVPVSDEDAYRTAVELARRDGILVGPTTGAVLYAAMNSTAVAGGPVVVISADDGFKYASFFQDFLEREQAREQVRDFDFSTFICPLSKIKAVEVLERLSPGETARVILGDTESVRNIIQELKSRGLKARFEQPREDRFVLTFDKDGAG